MSRSELVSPPGHWLLLLLLRLLLLLAEAADSLFEGGICGGDSLILGLGPWPLPNALSRLRAQHLLLLEMKTKTERRQVCCLSHLLCGVGA